MSETPTPVSIEPARKSFFANASFVWIIPILALAIALGVAWQSYTDRGPLIEIEFENGAGIAKRETELRFRDVAVGVVEDVKFASNLSGVVALVRIDKDIAPFVDVGASFWVVQPELSAQGVSGLDTVLTGVYIEGTWDGDIGPAQSKFKGLKDTPLYRYGKEGLEITLRTTAGGNLTDNSPITFRGIEVGRVGKAHISQQGSFAVAEAIIYHPHSRLISDRTRFWDTSGFTFSVGPGGAEIDFSSFATLVSGGLTFETFVSSGGRVSDGKSFEVFADEESARDSVFNASEAEPLQMRVVFDESISGLAVDAPVELSGFPIGRVTGVSGVIDADAFGDERVRLNALIDIQPARLGLTDEVTPEAALQFLSRRIEEGLRARLASASLLAGGLKIELVDTENVSSYVVQSGEGIIPIIPSTSNDISDVTATVAGVVSRINNLPIEELLNSAIQFLNSADALISNEDLRETPKVVRALLGDVRDIVGSDDVQNIPAKLNGALGRFETLLAQLEEEKFTTQLVAAVNAAAAAANGVNASVEGVPALVTQLQAVAAKAESLPLDALTEQLTSLTTSADAILGTDAAKKLPEDLGSALNEINATLRELREGGAVTNINATLDSTRKAADAVAISTQDLPALVERVQQVLNQANQTIAGYNKGEVLSRDAQSALRDISKAAEAMTSLARMLERNPGSLLRGR
ncbi:paraquat-inducible protein B [Litoreibacter ascidiaceicola]|uniref:Paraquat-inducible protein B n=1 Tax=Litoreibacter ascidiaceicola TaxID=1486859 RepID=A0A1M4ZWW7_9RHOB|nr:MlaD family protein [Litoreibacter ascidiaceicola]SHF22485.1 paraquat-inducible protein B [Litoreibacter ascidiaceicola]